MAIREELDLEEKARRRLPESIRGPADRIDHSVSRFLSQYGVLILRIAIGVVYIWFGALKVADRSPVEDLVDDVIFFASGDGIVIAMGVWEIIIGLGLIFPVALRLTLLMLWMQLAGTFLAFVVLPGRSFQDGNPLLLTTTGEFVLKNIVLISAGLVIGSTVRRHGRAAQRAD